MCWSGTRPELSIRNHPLEAAISEVRFEDLTLAFDFVGSAPASEHNAYINLDTGKIYWQSDVIPIEDEDIAKDIETSDRYLAIPHKLT
jgi:hypothetical protein